MELLKLNTYAENPYEDKDGWMVYLFSGTLRINGNGRAVSEGPDGQGIDYFTERMYEDGGSGVRRLNRLVRLPPTLSDGTAATRIYMSEYSKSGDTVTIRYSYLEGLRAIAPQGGLRSSRLSAEFRSGSSNYRSYRMLEEAGDILAPHYAAAIYRSPGACSGCRICRSKGIAEADWIISDHAGKRARAARGAVGRIEYCENIKTKNAHNYYAGDRERFAFSGRTSLLPSADRCRKKKSLVRLLRRATYRQYRSHTDDVRLNPDGRKRRGCRVEGRSDASRVRIFGHGGGIHSYRAARVRQSSARADFSIELTSGAERYRTPDTAGRLFKDLGFDALNFRTFFEDGSECASADQALNGAAIFNCTVTARYDETGLRSISGTWITSAEPSSREDTRAIGVATALVSFLDRSENMGIVCGEITGVEAGYLLSRSSQSVELNPVWRIAADTGTYFVNALSGEIII